MKKNQNYLCLCFILSNLLLLNPNRIFAQEEASVAREKASVDNGYYITYPDKLLIRTFLSQKYVPFTISSQGDAELKYKTTSKLNLGIGATTNGATLNLGYGFNFLNPDKGRGKTTGLDLQLRLYPRKWAIDVLGTFIKGYYLDPKDKNGLQLTNYYQRPDIKRNVVGLSVFRLSNPDKFSYRAAITQNEWQTKSAGSLLYGGEMYYGLIKGDSAIVPSKASNNYKQEGINRVNFFSVGPGIGYAYTLVIHKNFFVTGSAIGSLDLNFSSEEKKGNKQERQTNVTVVPGAIYRGAVGYNSSTWTVSANIVGNALYAGSASSTKEYYLPTGNVRFILAKKIGRTHK